MSRDFIEIFFENFSYVAIVESRKKFGPFSNLLFKHCYDQKLSAELITIAQNLGDTSGEKTSQEMMPKPTLDELLEKIDTALDDAYKARAIERQRNKSIGASHQHAYESSDTPEASTFEARIRNGLEAMIRYDNTLTQIQGLTQGPDGQKSLVVDLIEKTKTLKSPSTDEIHQFRKQAFPDQSATASTFAPGTH